MRIGIDISQLAYPGTGVAVYTDNLVKSLLALDKKNEYTLFFSSLRKKFLISNFEFLNKSQIANPNFQTKTFKLPPTLLEFLWNRFHVVSIEIFTGPLDIFHTSDWLEPPTKCPKVTTIHDLVVYKYPETFTPKGGHDIVSNLKRKLKWVKRESKLVIAVSENTKRDIVEILGIPEEKIRVVYEAADEVYNKQQTTNNIDKTKKKYGIKGDYILAVGTREPRKNLKRVIEAHEKLGISPPTGGLKLVIAGKFGWGDQSSIINHQSSIKLLGYVPKEDLAVLYSGAKVFVYPSLYEGFGLPVLEAMSCGCPVVTSNVSSMPEVAGDAAVLVNPESMEEITEGIKKAMKEREDLVKKGLKRAKEFSWEKTARQTLEVYKEAAIC